MIVRVCVSIMLLLKTSARDFETTSQCENNKEIASSCDLSTHKKKKKDCELRSDDGSDDGGGGNARRRNGRVVMRRCRRKKK